MVGEIRVHDYHVVAGSKLQAVYVCGSETQLAGAGFQEDMRSVSFRELVGNDLGSIGAAIVDDYEFPVQISGNGILEDDQGRAIWELTAQ